jgi:hypothetical protein
MHYLQAWVEIKFFLELTPSVYTPVGHLGQGLPGNIDASCDREDQD